jgi:hypothetical protein
MTLRSVLLGLLLPWGALAAQAVPPADVCAPIAPDSARFGPTPVFAPCAVDVPARLRRTARPVGAYFPDGVRCLIAELEFLVDERGTPVVRSARVLSTSTPAFADAVLRSLERWRYDAAQRQGVPVRQLVRGRIAHEDERLPFVVLQPGEHPPARPAQPRCE